MILVAGSANLDFVVRANHIPGPGETVLGREFNTYPGGKGANQAVACARAGAVPTQFLVALGADAYAVPLEASLLQAGVDVQVVRTTQHPTGTAFICVSDDAENAIAVAPGANTQLRPEHLPPMDGISHLLMQLEIPLKTVQAYAQSARAQGVCTVLNAAPAHPLPEGLLDFIDVLIVNEGELRALTGHDGTVIEGIAQLQVPTVVVTLGKQGCLARHRGQNLLQTAFNVEALDTTGAGDTFSGVLTASLAQGKSLTQALTCASAAGALACTRAGAQTSVPTAAEVQKFLAAQIAPDTLAMTQLRIYCGLSRGD